MVSTGHEYLHFCIFALTQSGTFGKECIVIHLLINLSPFYVASQINCSYSYEQNLYKFSKLSLHIFNDIKTFSLTRNRYHEHIVITLYKLTCIF